MSLLFSLLLWGAALGMTVFWLWVIVIAIKKNNIVWGIVSIVINPVALVYALLNFDECKKPLMVLAFGFACSALYVGIPIFLM